MRPSVSFGAAEAAVAVDADFAEAGGGQPFGQLRNAVPALAVLLEAALP